MSTDAIVVLKQDHKEVRRLFRAFLAAGENAKATKHTLVDKIVEALTVHTYIENEVMYPRVRELVPDLEADILQAFEEHHVADVLCGELDTLGPDDERFDAKAAVLIDTVNHHIQEEENDWFPKVRAALGRKELQEIGERMIDLRTTAPRRPQHPGALRKAADAIFR